ncbi:4-hydroxy-tetrahydrodipicolinate reductase [Halocalculus aciditolerans]
MGREILAEASERGVDVAFAVNRGDGHGDVAGVDVEPADDFPDLLAERAPDVVVDFTGPVSSVEYVRACADAGVPVVVGTTGFSDAQLDELQSYGDDAPVLVGANFSRGIQALRQAVQSAVGSLPEYDVEVTETHHNRKRDAPSGTAKVLLDAVDDARNRDAERVHGREGDQPREEGEIGVHARRAGDVTGEHEVLLAGNDEVLELTHRAGSRGVFAAGALDAAEWLTTADAGFYRFTEVAARL